MSRTIWRYTHADFKRANTLLDEVNWDELLNGDVDQMWAAGETEFMSVMHQCIPTANLSAKPNVPWLHKGLSKHFDARKESDDQTTCLAIRGSTTRLPI